MKTKILGLLALGMLAGPIGASAAFLYTFDQTGTSNSVSFTVPSILKSSQDPLTQAIGQTVGGVTIADAFFGHSNESIYCVVFAGSGSDAFNCGISSETGAPFIGELGILINPTAVGVYNIFPISWRDFPPLDRLTISNIDTVPESGSMALLGLGLAGLGLSRRRKAD